MGGHSAQNPRLLYPPDMQSIQHPSRAAAAALLALLLASGAGAADRVYPNPEGVEPLATGTRVPSVRVETVGAKPVDLAELVRDRGALLVYYRGGW